MDSDEIFYGLTIFDTETIEQDTIDQKEAFILKYPENVTVNKNKYR